MSHLKMQSVDPHHTALLMYSSRYPHLTIHMEAGRQLSWSPRIDWAIMDLPKDTYWTLSTWHSYLTPNCRRDSSYSSIIVSLKQSNVRVRILSVVHFTGLVAPKYTQNTQQAKTNSYRSEIILFLFTTSFRTQSTRAMRLGLLAQEPSTFHCL